MPMDAEWGDGRVDAAAHGCWWHAPRRGLGGITYYTIRAASHNLNEPLACKWRLSLTICRIDSAPDRAGHATRRQSSIDARKPCSPRATCETEPRKQPRTRTTSPGQHPLSRTHQTQRINTPASERSERMQKQATSRMHGPPNSSIASRISSRS
jgi:hypothetical protein